MTETNKIVIFIGSLVVGGIVGIWIAKNWVSMFNPNPITMIIAGTIIIIIGLMFISKFINEM